MDSDISEKLGLKSLGKSPCPQCGAVCEKFSVFGQVRYDCEACGEKAMEKKRAYAKAYYAKKRAAAKAAT